MSAGWVLLVAERGLGKRDRARIAGAGEQITTVTSDVLTALLLAGSGQAAGVLVADYSLLAPAIRELAPEPWRPGRTQAVPACCQDGMCEQHRQAAALPDQRRAKRPRWTS